MKKPLIIKILIGLCLLTGGLVLFLIQQEKNDGILMLSGTIEVTDTRMSFKIPGRLHERLIDEGDTVAEGQLVARLDPRDEQLALEKAEASLAYSKARLEEFETGSRQQEIDDARAELERALAAERTAASELDRAEKDDRRYAELYAEGVISASDYDRFHTFYKTSRSRHEEAVAGVQRARELVSLRLEGFRKEQVAQVRARLAVDREVLNQAMQRLEYTELRAPFSGVVLSESAEEGEYLNPGSPVVTIGDMLHPWLRVYVGERHLGRVKLGQKVRVTADSWPKRVFEGRITFISSEAEFTPKIVQTFEERVKLVYRIKIQLENPEGLLKPGMPADAHIEAGAL